METVVEVCGVGTVKVVTVGAAESTATVSLRLAEIFPWASFAQAYSV